MELIDDIIQGEIVFPRRFAEIEERDYGILYYTPGIPDSHDGNHACILHARDLAEALADVQDFYHAMGVLPRIYSITRPGGGRELRQAAVAAGFKFLSEASQTYVHRRPSGIAPNTELTIERVQSPSPRLLAMIEQSDDKRAMEVIRRSLACPSFHLLVGSLGDQPVSMAAVERAGNVARVDDVLTHKPYRGRGYSRALMHELVQYHSRVFGGVLGLYTDNPTAARIYEEAGFDKLDLPIECWSAWQQTPDSRQINSRQIAT